MGGLINMIAPLMGPVFSGAAKIATGQASQKDIEGIAASVGISPPSATVSDTASTVKERSAQGKAANLATAGGWQGITQTSEDEQMGKKVKRSLLG